MENKEIKKLLLNDIKNELKDFAHIQRELKKSRKLQFRPKDRELQDICDEINNNKYKISAILYYYRWLKHGLKYWIRRDIHDYWDYQTKCHNPKGWYTDLYRNKLIIISKTKTYKKCQERNYQERDFKCVIKRLVQILIKKYDIKIFDEDMDKLLDYLYKNGNKKFYGPKPSYVFMKKELKGPNNEYTGFYFHGMNLIYYCIKHDFNETQVSEYLDKEIPKCKKYLHNNTPKIYHMIYYHIYRDIINTSKDDFILNMNRRYKYDWDTHKRTDEIEDYYWYDWINKSMRFNDPNNRYKTFFRQVSEHSMVLDDLFKRKGYCQCEIRLDKRYNREGYIDKVFVIFMHNCLCGDEKDFKRMCMNYWHFIKLLDYVSEEDNNDIDIYELYKRKEVDKFYDDTKPQAEVRHTKGFAKAQTKTGVWGMVKGILTKLYNK